MPLLNLDETEIPPPPEHTWWCAGHTITEYCTPQDGWDDVTSAGVYHRCRLALPSAEIENGKPIEICLERTSFYDWERDPDNPRVWIEETKILLKDGHTEMSADQARHFADILTQAANTASLVGDRAVTADV